MSESDVALISGALATLGGMAVWAVSMLTADFTPVERKARRFATLSACLAVGAVAIFEWGIYRYVSEVAAMFLIAPCLPMAALAAWFGAQAAYRMFGGGQVEEVPESPKVYVERETLERQGDIWCSLRELPHFRETLSGQLINLVSGDRLYWTEVDGKKCIEIKLAGRTRLTGSRYETMTKYLAVQRGLANALGMTALGGT